MKKKFTFKVMLLLCALIVGCGTVWAQSNATITFASTSGSDATNAYTTSDFVSAGIASSNSAFGTITCSATSRCFKGKDGYGLKAGGNSTSKPGSFTIAFSPLANVTKITLNRASYSDSKTATITVKNGSTTLGNASTPSGTAAFSDMEITGLSIESLSGLTVETSQYCYIKSITITYGNDKATTTTISDSGITNTNKFLGTAAGSLSASVTYGSPATEVPYASVTWSGNNDDVATINSTTGAVTLVGAGTVTFTASFEGLTGYSNSSATYVMTVTNEDPALSTIWSEDFYSYSADAVPSGGTYSYACTNGTKTSGSTNGGTTAVKNEKLAEGTAEPELMVGRKGSGEGAQGGTFSATIPLASSNGYGYSGDLTLTYKTNAQSLNVKTTTSDLTVDGESSTGAGVTFNTKETHTVTFKGVNTSTENITIVFTATTTSNVRLDDIVLKGVITIPVNENNEIVSNVTIPAGASYVVPSTGIIIPSGNTLTVNGTLVNTDATKLTIEDGGQLITSNAVQATVKKSVTHGAKVAENWYTIASPINTPTFDKVANLIQATAENYDLYRYNETSMMWENQKNSTDHADFTTLENGRGYLYWNNTGAELSFAGEVNASNVTYDLTYDATNDALKGFNLIGNPFPHNIYKGTGGAINDSKLAAGFYVLNNASGWSAKLDYQTAILPGQGILVETTEAFTLTIANTNAASSADTRSSSNDLITFNVSNDKYEDVAYVQFKDAIGLNKIEHLNAEIPMLYIHQNDENYAIANMDRDVANFDLNFVAATAGEYTLSAKTMGEFGYFHLIDRIAGKDIDMLNEGKYTFTADPEDYEYRFIVKLSDEMNNGINAEMGEEFAFISNGQLIVNGTGTIQIIDMMGRVVSTRSTEERISTDGMTAGVYVLQLVNGTDVKTQKVVIR